MHRLIRESRGISLQLGRALRQRSQTSGNLRSASQVDTIAVRSFNFNARSLAADRAVNDGRKESDGIGERGVRPQTTLASDNPSSNPPPRSKVRIVAALLLLTAGASSAYWYFENEKQNKRKIELSVKKRPVSQESHAHLQAVLPLVNEKDEVTSGENTDLMLQNKILEDAVKSSLQSAIEKIHLVTDAKYETISAIKEHTKILKQTIDDGQDGDWSKVTVASDVISSLSALDAQKETDARNYLDNAYQVLQQGQSSEQTQTNPLLSNANLTLKKLARQLDEMNMKIRKARNDGRIINEYKDLIDKSRKEFAKELKSILPSIDLHAQESKLNEEELNALIAHAHLKIDQLRRQLIEQQVREEQNIANFLEEQGKSQKEINDQELRMKIEEFSEDSELEMENLISMKRKLWEVELEEKLQRAAAAHSEHIEEVVRAQRNLFEIEQKQKISDAITEERAIHSKQFANAQGRLEAMEAALKTRFAQDIENRRAKQLWIACQNLVGSVVYGIKGGTDMEARRKPLAIELQIIREACDDDEFVSTIVNSLSDEIIYKGIYTEEDLQTRFKKLYSACRRIAKMDENQVGILHYFLSYLQNMVSFDVAEDYSKSEKFDPQSLDSYEILGRAKHFVGENDFASAVRMLNLLSGPTKNIARDWIHDAVAHLEARFVAELLVLHAAVSGFSSLY